LFQNGVKYREYIAVGVNNTWSIVGNDIVLDKLNQTLVGGIIDVRYFPAKRNFEFIIS
jgi:hypothetical protein